MADPRTAVALNWFYNHPTTTRASGALAEPVAIQTQEGDVTLWSHPTEPEPTRTVIDNTIIPAWETNKNDERAFDELDQRALAKTLLDVFTDYENRIRVLESRPAVTRRQVRTALMGIFKGYL